MYIPCSLVDLGHKLRKEQDVKLQEQADTRKAQIEAAIREQQAHNVRGFKIYMRGLEMTLVNRKPATPRLLICVIVDARTPLLLVLWALRLVSALLQAWGHPVPDPSVEVQPLALAENMVWRPVV